MNFAGLPIGETFQVWMLPASAILEVGSIDPLERATYQMHLFWVITPEGNPVVPVSFPASYREIENGRAYSSNDFFSLLAKLPHIEGIQAP